MQRFLRRTPKREFWPKVWLVHNVYPGPPDDPGRHRMIGLDGFRIWITDEADKLGHRCHCGWLDGARALRDGQLRRRARRVLEPCPTDRRDGIGTHADTWDLLHASTP